MADELTQIDPSIAKLADYYRNPAEKREGEGLAKRLLRISLSLASESKAHYDARQQALERLFAANVQINQTKERQKLARQEMELRTQEATEHITASQQKRAQAKVMFDAAQRVRAMMTPMEQKAAAGTPEWATPGGQEKAGADLAQTEAYTEYLGRLPATSKVSGTPDKTPTKNAQSVLDSYGKSLNSLWTDITKPPSAAEVDTGSFNAPEVVSAKEQKRGEYLRDSYHAKNLAEMFSPTGAQSGDVIRHAQNAQAALAKIMQEIKITVDQGNTGFGSRLLGTSKPPVIKSLLEVTKEKSDQLVGMNLDPTTYGNTMQKAMSTLLSSIPELANLVAGMGGPDEAAAILLQFFVENTQVKLGGEPAAPEQAPQPLNEGAW